jgi:hypothetical protein
MMNTGSEAGRAGEIRTRIAGNSIERLTRDVERRYEGPPRELEDLLQLH